MRPTSFSQCSEFQNPFSLNNEVFADFGKSGEVINFVGYDVKRHCDEFGSCDFVGTNQFGGPKRNLPFIGPAQQYAMSDNVSASD